MTRTIQIELDFKPHTNQREPFFSPVRFRVLVAGRRWGKSRLAAMLAVTALTQGKAVWWVAPTFDIAKRVGWRTIEYVMRPLVLAGLATANKSDLLIELPNGGRFQAKSADQPERLVGEGLDLIICDEAGIMPERAWSESLRPTLADRGGKAVFIGTPKGHNWFFNLYNQGLDPLQPDWQSWQFPTSANPFIDPAEIEAARLDLPQRTFEQEFLAEFKDDAGAVFRNVAAVSTLPAREPYRGDFVFGIDFARDNDFTVISVIDRQTRQQVAVDRFNQIGWAVQRGRIAAMYTQWKPRTIIAEENSIGSVNIEALQAEGLPVRAFQTTGTSKPPLIDALALALERQEINLLDDPVQKAELQAYTLTRLPSGSYRYEAPKGGHDDTVMALALAWHGVNYGRLAMPLFL